MRRLFRNIRAALLVLFCPRLIMWAADALEIVQDDPKFRAALNSWELQHLDEAASTAARVHDCWRYIEGKGPRVDDIKV